MNTSTSVKHAAVSKKLKKGILSQQNNILSISSLPGYILFIPHLFCSSKVRMSQFTMCSMLTSRNMHFKYDQFCLGMVVQLFL